MEVTLDIQVATGSTTPIYWQIVDHVTRAVANGELRSGEQLPSVRSLAERLVINPNTVSRAYSDLVRDGVIEARRGVGLFVTERRSVLTDMERGRLLNQALDVFLHDIRLLDFSREDVTARLESRWPTNILAGGKE